MIRTVTASALLVLVPFGPVTFAARGPIESIDSMHPHQPPDPIHIPIDGTLDLHTFRPRDLKPVLLDYIALCRERGIIELRIIHGKGIGQLRATVHSLLAKHPQVLTYHRRPFNWLWPWLRMRLTGAAEVAMKV